MSAFTSLRRGGARVPPTSWPAGNPGPDAGGRGQLEMGSGALPAGSRLPPVRALENQLGLLKNTAQAAYDELVARGLVETREREGVFVLGSNPLQTPPP